MIKIGDHYINPDHVVRITEDSIFLSNGKEIHLMDEKTVREALGGMKNHRINQTATMLLQGMLANQEVFEYETTSDMIDSAIKIAIVLLSRLDKGGAA